tara:strand:+ start:784 stop:1611 length:828 start_codon:yes stop_codon:yes gene_type:complete
MISIFLAPIIFGLDVDNVQVIFNNPSNPGYSGALKFIQFFNSLGLFVIPPFLFLRYYKERPIDYLQLNKSVNGRTIFFLLLIYMISIPGMEWLIKFNGQLSLQESLQGVEAWMRNAEDTAKEMTTAFLTMDGIGDLIINLLLIAVIPAIGEELLFRGVLQKQLQGWTKNGHLAVWIAAFVFSAIHLQFYGFLPRLILGALFGYYYLWSNNLWVPIIAHFINNATAVVISYATGSTSTDVELEAMNREGSEIYVIISLLILYLTLKRLKQNMAEAV